MMTHKQQKEFELTTDRARKILQICNILDTHIRVLGYFKDN